VTKNEAAAFGWNIAAEVMPYLGLVALVLLVLGIMHGWLGGH
jgi:hypothetical protein